ncbi:MAG: HAD family hydrolase, partial [Planctomycetota bacterium]
MSEDPYVALIRASSSPLEPLPTGVEPQLSPLEDVQAVLFDVYGTLLVSGSGDIGASDPAPRGRALVESLSAVGLEFNGEGDEGAAELRRQIEMSHRESRRSDIEYPEVRIDQIWRSTCQRFAEAGRLSLPTSGVDYKRLAIEFEVRTNPVWPMPGAAECLAALRRRGVPVGIVSNAQFFTPLAIEATFGRKPESLGVDPALQYYSYEHGHAKPGVWLYEQAAATLQRNGVKAWQALYVGNDMRNDVHPAAATKFRTALFAGDRRSLRMRRDEARA